MNRLPWEFGRGRPRLGGLSVEKTEERRIAAMQNGAKRGHATRDSAGTEGAARSRRRLPPSEPEWGWNETRLRVG